MPAVRSMLAAWPESITVMPRLASSIPTASPNMPEEGEMAIVVIREELFCTFPEIAGLWQPTSPTMAASARVCLNIMRIWVNVSDCQLVSEIDHTQSTGTGRGSRVDGGVVLSRVWYG